MPYYVYVIASITRSYIYVGITYDAKRRIGAHNKGHNKTTRPYKTFKTVLIEKYSSRSEARAREKFLKSGCGKEWLKKINKTTSNLKKTM